MIKLGSKLKILKTASKATALLPNGQISKVASAEDNSEYSNDFLYFIARALTANVPNANGDYFPEDELQKSYQSFIGKNLHLNHDADDVAKAVGKIIDAWFVKNDDDIYVVCLCKVDKKLHPELARNIETGIIDSVSMGCSCQECECSICGCKAHNESEMCDHLKNFLGREINVNGKTEKVSSINRGITFNELSLVGDPADSNAHMYQIYANKRGNDMKKKAMQDGKTEDVVQDEVKQEIEKTLKDKEETETKAEETPETTKTEVKEEIKEVEDKLKEVKEIVEEKKEELKDLKEEVKDIKEEKVEEKKEEVVEEKKEETEEKVEKEECNKKAESEEEIKGIEEIKEKAEEAVKEDKEKEEKTETKEETKEEVVEETKEEKKEDKAETLEEIQEKVEDIKEEIVAEIGDLFSPVKDETKEFAITDIFEDNGEKFVETEVEGKKKVYALKNVKLKKSATGNSALQTGGNFLGLNLYEKYIPGEEDNKWIKVNDQWLSATETKNNVYEYVKNQMGSELFDEPEGTVLPNIRMSNDIAIRKYIREHKDEIKEFIASDKNKTYMRPSVAFLSVIGGKANNLEKQAEAPAKPTTVPSAGMKWVFNKNTNAWEQKPENTKTVEVEAAKKIFIAKKDNEIIYSEDIEKVKPYIEKGYKLIESKETALDDYINAGVNVKKADIEYKYTLIRAGKQPRWLVIDKATNKVAQKLFLKDLPKEAESFAYKTVIASTIKEVGVSKVAAKLGVSKKAIKVNDKYTLMVEGQEPKTLVIENIYINEDAKETFIKTKIDGSDTDDNIFSESKFLKMIEDGEIQKAEIVEEVKEVKEVKEETVVEETAAENGVETTEDTVPMNQDETSEPMNDLQSSRRNRILRKKAGYTYKEISNIGYEEGTKDGAKYKETGEIQLQTEIDKNLKELKAKYEKDEDMGSYVLREWDSFVAGYTNGFSDGWTGHVEKKASFWEVKKDDKTGKYYLESANGKYQDEEGHTYKFNSREDALEEIDFLDAEHKYKKEMKTKKKADAGDGVLVPQADPTPDFKMVPEVKPNEANTLEITDEQKDVIKREITPMEEIANLMNVLQIKLSEVDDKESKLDFVRREIQDAIDYVDGKPIEEIEKGEEEELDVPEIAEFTDIKWEESDNAELPMVASVDVDDINWNNINAKKDGAAILAHIYKAKPLSYKVAFKKANKMNKTAAKITKVAFVDVLKAQIDTANKEIQTMKMTAQIKEKRELCDGIVKEAMAKGFVKINQDEIRKNLVKGMSLDEAREMAVRKAADEQVKNLMAMDKTSLNAYKETVANFTVPTFKTKPQSIGRITASADYDTQIELPWSRKR